MSLLNRLERYLGRFAVPNLSLYLVVGQVLFLGLALLAGFDLNRIILVPVAVREGEAWRLITFLFVPTISRLTMVGALFFALKLYLLYLMGNALEHFWGEFRFNVYVFVGLLVTVAASFIFPDVPATNVYLLASIYLAFAWVNPEFELSIYGIIPVKIKWLALILWLWGGFLVVVGSWPVRTLVLASVVNFLIFLGRDVMQWAGSGRRRMARQNRPFSKSSDEAEPRHRCHKCGKTDLTHPQTEFRYCSKCAGDECYCSEHIANHEHTVNVLKKS